MALNVYNPLLASIPTSVENTKFIHFVVVVIENIWRTKNGTKFSKLQIPWDSVYRKVNPSTKRYWNGRFNRRKSFLIRLLDNWEPPPSSWVTCNVDVVVHSDKTWAACLMRGHLEKPTEAWVFSCHFSNVYSVELKAFLLAF